MIRDKYPPRVEFDFTTGSLQDQSANSYSSTFTAGGAYWGKGERGRNLVFDGATTDINLGDVSDFDNDEVQSFASVFQTTDSNIRVFMSKSNDTPFKGWNFYMSAGKLIFRMYENLATSGFRVSSDDTFNDGDVHSAVITYDGNGGTGVKIYVDNKEVEVTIENDVAFTGSTLTSANLNIGMASYGSLWWDGPLYKVMQFGVELSSEEAVQLLEELNTAIQYNLTQINGLSFPTGRQLLAEGKDLVDRSVIWNRFNDGVASYPDAEILRVSYGGTNTYYVGQYVMCAGCKYKLTGQARSDGTVVPNVSILTSTAFTGTNSTDWQDIDIEFNYISADGRIFFGSQSGTGGYVEFRNLRLIELNEESQDAPTNLLESVYIADGKGWNESVSSVTSGFIENTGWQVDSGSFDIVDERDETKAIEMGQASIAYMPNPITGGYGTWEFELWKEDEIGQPYVSIMQDRVAQFADGIGYQIVVSSIEQVFLRRTTAGGAVTVLSTATGVFPLQQWVKFKITRDASGTWNMWIDGVQVGSGAVDNTYVTGLPFVNINSSNPVGDKVRNFKFIPYIQ